MQSNILCSPIFCAVQYFVNIKIHYKKKKKKKKCSPKFCAENLQYH